MRGRADGASSVVLQTSRLVPKLLLHRGAAGIRDRRNDAEGLMRMLALACSGSVAAGIEAYEFDIKTKQNEWFDRFFYYALAFKSRFDRLDSVFGTGLASPVQAHEAQRRPEVRR